MSNSVHPMSAAALPLRSPLVVIDDFLPAELALSMRADIDRHFANPGQHKPDTHQVWNYWFVPELYSYLRTQPDKVIRRDSVEGFMKALRHWSVSTLGMAQVTWPYLSLYIPGCRQGWHNDAKGGRFAFVYSLTRNERRNTGGETLVMREGDPFRTNLAQAAAGRMFFESVAPKFNRLVVFDDRIPHGVDRSDGVMDPLEGRFVLHGHMIEAGAAVSGALPAHEAVEPVAAVLRRFTAQATERGWAYHGPMALRLVIAPAGSVESCDVLVDRVIHPDPTHTQWETLRDRLVVVLRTLTFPPTAGRTTVILPHVFGGAVGAAPAPRPQAAAQ